MKTILTLIGYREDWVDTCRGCHMQSFGSLSHFGQYNNIDEVIEFYAHHMVKFDDADRLNTGGSMDFLLMVDQIVVWRSNGCCLNDDGTLIFDLDEEWDEFEALRDDKYVNLHKLAKDRIAELKKDRDSKNKALEELERKKKAEAKRKEEMAEYKRLHRLYSK
jgi:hypothetical protein